MLQGVSQFMLKKISLTGVWPCNLRQEKQLLICVKRLRQFFHFDDPVSSMLCGYVLLIVAVLLCYIFLKNQVYFKKS